MYPIWSRLKPRLGTAAESGVSLLTDAEPRVYSRPSGAVSRYRTTVRESRSAPIARLSSSMSNVGLWWGDAFPSARPDGGDRARYPGKEEGHVLPAHGADAVGQPLGAAAVACRV